MLQNQQERVKIKIENQEFDMSLAQAKELHTALSRILYGENAFGLTHSLKSYSVSFRDGKIAGENFVPA